MGSLEKLFAPDSVAVVGATEREGSVGHAIMTNLLDEYDGEVVPINPKRDELFGLECYEDLGQVPYTVDMAVVVVPPTIVNDVVEQAGEVGVQNLVIITAGFGETGSEGAQRERDLRELAEEYDLNVVGPNCLGIMNTDIGMNATFGPDSPLEGNISFMSQSGAFITAVLDWALDEGIGFKDIVSLGNKAVMDSTDFIEFWEEDPETDVVIAYLESIDEGDEFIETAREASQDTPIVVLKSGRTDAAAQAASSHTGAIAGAEEAYEAGFKQSGVLRANTVQEMFDYARALSGMPLPDTEEIAIVTNAGGPGVMATDAVGDSDVLEMAEFENGTVEALEEDIPEGGNIYNPIDVVGDADVERFEKALDIALQDPNVGSALVLSAPTAVIDYENLSDMVAEMSEKHGLPIAGCLMGGERAQKANDALSEYGIPNYFDPSQAVKAIEGLTEYANTRREEIQEPTEYDVDRERAREILERAEEGEDNRLGVEAMELLDAYGIPTPQGDIVDSPDQAHEVAEAIDGPVVMKIVSPDILHKSDIGGVKVGVEQADVRDAYEDLITRARNYQPDANILGVQVQEMIDLDDQTETIVGMNRDPQFGPLVMFGLGGIFVEVMEDTSIRVAPVSDKEATEMVDEIQAAPLLRGARGQTPADEDEIIETIQRLSQLVTDFPAILELDINPLVAGADGVEAVDLRLTVDTDQL
ncbi:MAG: acetyl coenzyme A synthetase (ADP forming)-like protein [Natronomonas sp.]|jgi:acetyl coenzyme A synthetase (ADP forming)-like protein